MARNGYGNTWWGEQWLKSLTKIDNSNRLPRGKTYANKGAVKNINIAINSIQAQVSGSAPRPYKITIDVPLFSAVDQRRVVDIVSENPVFLSALLSRSLPIELDEACKQEGIAIFPSSWRSFGMKCSCPDYAVPCKHLAAVLYIVANEIDKNPFMVFEMHGFNLLKALESSGISATDAQVEVIATVAALSKTEKQPTRAIRLEVYDDLDFSTLPNLTETLPNILSANPVFYPKKDFKAVYAQTLKKIAKEGNRTFSLGRANETEQQVHDLERIEKGNLYINADFKLDKIGFESDTDLVFTTNQFSELIAWIQAIPSNRIKHFDASLIALHTAYRFALKLIAEGAIVPQLLAASKDEYILRWLPALLNEQVKAQYDIFEQLVPDDFVIFKHAKKAEHATASENALSLLSLLLTQCVTSWSGIKESTADAVEGIFFCGKKEVFKTFETREIPNAIQLWSNRFYLTERDILPLLRINDNDGDFEIDLLLENKRLNITTPIPFKAIFEENYRSFRLEALKTLTLLTEHFPQLNQIVASKGTKVLKFNSQDFVKVFFEILPIMRLLGIQVLLPKALNKLFRPQMSLQLMTENVRVDYGTSVLSMDNLLKFNWKIALGSGQVSPEAFLALVKGLSGIVQLKGEYVFLDEKEIKAVLKKLENPPQLTTIDLLQIALAEEYDGTPIELTPKVRELMSYLMSGEGLAIPHNLNATLRPYQQRGYEWLYKNTRLGFGSIIADDMGLGKTLQVITLLLKLKEDQTITEKNKALVVLPTSLLTNWSKEITRFAADLNAMVYHGSNRKWEVKGMDIVLTTYGVVRSENSIFTKEKWSVMVIDEAQNIKNPNTEQAKAVKKVTAKVKVAMSGTPVENRLSEYWSIFDFSNKGYLKNLNAFKNTFAYPIEVEKDHRVLNKFKKVTAPFILRRLKSDKSIIQDLPDKIEINQYCNLTPEQAALYQNVVTALMPKEDADSGNAISRQGAILQLLTALKQVCNHPVQFAKKGTADPALSGKSQQLMELLESILENDEKTLIFTQYAEMGELLVAMIKTQFGIHAPFLHGGLSRAKRDEMVEQFQNKASSRILILSLKAGGTGLNLTAANHVVHYDLWWNPAVEAQATDRAYRIGQQRNVNVHRFISQNTMEEKIDKLIQSKKELADMSVTTGESWLGDLSNKELRALVALS